MRKSTELSLINQGVLAILLSFNLVLVASAQDPHRLHVSSDQSRLVSVHQDKISGVGTKILVTLPAHRLELNLTLANHRSLDKLASPLIYRGNLGGVELRYHYSGKRNRHLVMAGISGGNLGTSVSHFSGAGSTLGLKYGYSHRVMSGHGNRFQVLLGGELEARGNVLETTEIIKENVSWIAMYVAAFGTEAEYKFGRSIISIRIAIPLVGLISRPPYGTYDDALLDILDQPLRVLTSGGGIHVIGQFLFVNQDVVYAYRLTSHFGLSARYHFGIYRFGEPRSIHQLTNSLNVGIRYEL